LGSSFQNRSTLAVESIWLAWARQNVDEALHGCEALRHRFPGDVDGLHLKRDDVIATLS